MGLGGGSVVDDGDDGESSLRQQVVGLARVSIDCSLNPSLSIQVA